MKKNKQSNKNKNVSKNVILKINFPPSQSFREYFNWFILNNVGEFYFHWINANGFEMKLADEEFTVVRPIYTDDFCGDSKSPV